MPGLFSLESIKAYAKSVDLFGKLRAKFVTRFINAGADRNSIVVLRGPSDALIYDTDAEQPFRFESFFFHLFGVEEPDVVGLLEVDTCLPHLFVPRLPINLGLFLVVQTPEKLHLKYGFPSHYLDEMAQILSQINPGKIYINKGTNSDSGVTTPYSYIRLPEFESYSVDENVLFTQLSESRAIKLEEEFEILRRVALAASEAHIKAMQSCKPEQMEYQLAGNFIAHAAINYGHSHSYNPICGSGHNGSILHYPNKDCKMQDGTMVLCDMGTYSYGYCSDVTCCYPVNGVFTDKQAGIYNAVLRANRTVINSMKPGVEWTDMHILAETVMLEDLKNLGIVTGDVSEMVEKRVGAVFFPHGLGHFLGMDVHDAGGYTSGPPKSCLAGINKLRTRRILEENMYITVEPGCYFIDFALDEALSNLDISRYLVADKIQEFRGFGGVRIEDDVRVTATGAEILNQVPRTTREIEACMRGESWI